MMEFIKQLFEDKMIEETRAPLFSTNILQYHVDFFAPNYQFFTQIIMILAFQMAVGALLAVIMYYGIVQQTKNRSTGTPQGYLIGYGLVIPAALWIPFYISDFLDLRSVCWRLGFASLPMTVTLRCLEAMYGFLPPISHKSLWNFVVSVGFILRPVLDGNGQTIRLSKKAFGQQLANHLKQLGMFAIIFHMALPFEFYPFPTTVQANEVLISFDLGHLYNTFVQAALMNATLGFSLTGVCALAGLMAGVVFDDNVTDFPMFLSSSPSDFWGRRWNNLIHVGLKQGVYKPVRWNTGSRTLASISAFCVSGIYHEYVWRLLFFATTAQLAEGMMVHSGECCVSCYCKGWFGKQLVFFGWNGILIALEYLLAGNQALSRWTGPLPSLLRSHLVVMLSLPVGHLFTADITNSGYFVNLQHALPMLQVSRIH